MICKSQNLNFIRANRESTVKNRWIVHSKRVSVMHIMEMIRGCYVCTTGMRCLKHRAEQGIPWTETCKIKPAAFEGVLFIWRDQGDQVISIGYYDSMLLMWIKADGFRVDDRKVTHWMPLPQLPIVAREPAQQLIRAIR